MFPSKREDPVFCGNLKLKEFSFFSYSFYMWTFVRYIRRFRQGTYFRCCTAIQFHGKHFSTLPYLLPPPALFNWGFPSAWPTGHKISSLFMLGSSPQSIPDQTGFKHASDRLLSTQNVQLGFCDLGASWDNSTFSCSFVLKAFLCITFTITPQLPFKYRGS